MVLLDSGDRFPARKVDAPKGLPKPFEGEGFQTPWTRTFEEGSFAKVWTGGRSLKHYFVLRRPNTACLYITATDYHHVGAMVGNTIEALASLQPGLSFRRLHYIEPITEALGLMLDGYQALFGHEPLTSPFSSQVPRIASRDMYEGRSRHDLNGTQKEAAGWYRKCQAYIKAVQKPVDSSFLSPTFPGGDWVYQEFKDRKDWKKPAGFVSLYCSETRKILLVLLTEDSNRNSSELFLRIIANAVHRFRLYDRNNPALPVQFAGAIKSLKPALPLIRERIQTLQVSAPGIPRITECAEDMLSRVGTLEKYINSFCEPNDGLHRILEMTDSERSEYYNRVDSHQRSWPYQSRNQGQPEPPQKGPGNRANLHKLAR